MLSGMLLGVKEWANNEKTKQESRVHNNNANSTSPAAVNMQTVRVPLL